MQLSISNGNSKIGKTLNISLPPIEACAKNLPCYKQCYAMKSYRQYPNVRKAWGGNLELYREDSAEYWAQLRRALRNTNRKYFRYHVAGDILDQDYVQNMIITASWNPHIKFLAHTKRFDLSYTGIPENLYIGFSMWPGLDIPDTSFMRTWLSHDERKPEKIFKCTGSCEECRYCWGDQEYPGDIEFELH